MNPTPRPDLDQALKDVLRPDPAPEALKEKLLAQAARAPRARSPWRALGLAAAALLVIGMASLAVPLRSLREGRIPLNTVMRSVSEELSSGVDRSFDGQACCGKACGDWAQSQAGFRAPLPRCVAEKDLRSGGACRIAGEAAAHYQLNDGRMVYVFQRPLEGCVLGGRTTLEHGPHIAQAWNEDGRGYLLIARR